MCSDFSLNNNLMTWEIIRALRGKFWDGIPIEMGWDGMGWKPLFLSQLQLPSHYQSDHGHFSSYEGHMERRTGKVRGAFSRMHRAFDAWMLARAPASPAQGLHHHGPRYFNFSYFCTMCGLEKLGLVDQNWLERNFSVFLLRTLVLGRRQHSESIEVALDME